MKRIPAIIASMLAFTAAFHTEISASERNDRPAPNMEIKTASAYSPDSSAVAQARNDGRPVWISFNDGRKTIRTGREEKGKTFLNGYASWVYYEEIFGRHTGYRAFWWSPDSKKLAFYSFDESEVTLYPIYSPASLEKAGNLNMTRYPLAGEKNPSVKIGICDISSGKTVWAAFANSEKRDFGTPFWSDDSRTLFVPSEPRRQNGLELFAIDAESGQPERIYIERYPTWVNWIEKPAVTAEGIYMVRDFETGWQQIYYLSNDGKNLKRLTDGENWDMEILKADGNTGRLWFSAKRDHRLHNAIYRLEPDGKITALTDPRFNARFPKITGNTVTVTLSTASTEAVEAEISLDAAGAPVMDIPPADSSARALPRVVKISNEGFDLYGLISLPEGFDPGKRYPVLISLYGGPGTSYVRDERTSSLPFNDWCYKNGIIFLCADPRSSGENGRRGMDQSFRKITEPELRDYRAWAKWLQGLPYVNGGRIGVQGFSFGGTTTAMLVLRYPELFRCGIAGGGVYDWRLYDTHYTERYMDLPGANPDGYDNACVTLWARRVLDGESNNIKPLPGALRLTHGTADDNVHLQNTLLLATALQDMGYQFEMMLYPDALHGYYGKQGRHSDEADHIFWTKWLLDR